MKLGLGTVEFAGRRDRQAEKPGGGCCNHAYNLDTRPTLDEAGEILKLAIRHGVDLLDTAGQSVSGSEVLGDILPGGHHFRIITRAPRFATPSISQAQADQLEQNLLGALESLRQPSVDTLMLGVSDGLLAKNADRLVQKMDQLRERGLIRKIGVTISDSVQLERMLAVFKPDLVQLPLNVLDQRLLGSGHLQRLKRDNIEIHARDIFLQGVLLDPTHLHPWFWPIRKLLASYHDFLIAQGLTPLEGALAFIGSVPEVDYALVGVQSSQQLLEITQAVSDGFSTADFAPFACPDPRFIDPRLWNLYE